VPNWQLVSTKSAASVRHLYTFVQEDEELDRFEGQKPIEPPRETIKREVPPPIRVILEPCTTEGFATITEIFETPD